MSRKSKAKERRQLAKEHKSRSESAWHEAAHAVSAEYFDMPVDFVTCVESDIEGKHYFGYTEMVNYGEIEVTELRAVYMVVQGCAGCISEWRRGTLEHGKMFPGDIEEMRDAGLIDGLSETKIEHIFEITERFLAWAWDVVSEIASLLIAHGRVEGNIVREMVRSRLGYILAEDQLAGLFEGVVIRPESEASKRTPFLFSPKGTNA
jgi:hypothetical protein